MTQKQNSTLQLFDVPTASPHKQSTLKPFVKWPGGKTRELEMIWRYLPASIDRFYEPFVGGGAVYFAMPEQISQFFINDKSERLTDIYRLIQSQDKTFMTLLTQLNDDWKDLATHFNTSWYTILLEQYQSFKTKWNETLEDAPQDEQAQTEALTPVQKQADVKRELRVQMVNIIEKFDLAFIRWSHVVPSLKRQLQKVIPAKMVTINKNERKNGALSTEDLKGMLLTSVKQGFYDHMRSLLNNFDKAPSEMVNKAKFACVYYFIRMFTYSSMFRYNASGDFNVPYGGKSYNKNSFDDKLTLIQSKPYQARLGSTIITTGEYRDLLTTHPPQNNDFIFLDPPYDSEFSTYEKNSFEQSDQEKLANFLIDNFPNKQAETYPKWMMVIKNTDLIYKLYSSQKAKDAGIKIEAFDKNYAVSFMNRNDQAVKHLVIMNYNPNEATHTPPSIETSTKKVNDSETTSTPSGSESSLPPIQKAFYDFDIPKFSHELSTFLYSIPYPDSKERERREENYRNCIFAHLNGAIGHDKVHCEVRTNKGRSDISIVDYSQVFVIELKVVKIEDIDKELHKGLKQMRDRNYGQRYRQNGRPVALICVVICDRSIKKVGYQVFEKHKTSLTSIEYIPFQS